MITQPYRGPGDGDPVVDEFYIDFDSYPIMLGAGPYRVLEVQVSSVNDDRSPTGRVTWRRTLIDGRPL